MLAMSLCLVSIYVFSAHVCELWLHAKQIVLPVNSRERARPSLHGPQLDLAQGSRSDFVN